VEPRRETWFQGRAGKGEKTRGEHPLERGGKRGGGEMGEFTTLTRNKRLREGAGNVVQLCICGTVEGEGKESISVGGNNLVFGETIWPEAAEGRGSVTRKKRGERERMECFVTVRKTILHGSGEEKGKTEEFRVQFSGLIGGKRE